MSFKRDDDGFNHPPTLLVALPGVKGQHTVNLASLGLPSSLRYPALSALSGLDQGNSYLESATIKPQRDKAYAEVYDAVNGLSLPYPVNMVTGAVTGAIQINPNNPGRTFSNISVDESTGDDFATTTGTQGPCLDGVAYMMVKIDPVAGTASPAATMPACTAGVAPANKGTTLSARPG